MAYETFYLRASGNGSAPKTVGGAYDAADFNTAGNWTASDAEDDNLIGPGDTVIVLDDDGPIRAQLTVQQSGLSGKPITIQGENVAATVSAADLITSWTDNSSGVYDWEWDMESSPDSPWDFTSVTDPGGDFTRSATALHDGSYGLLLASNDASAHYVSKTVSYSSSVYTEFWFKADASFTQTGVGASIVRLRGTAFDWLADIVISGGNFALQRNQPSYNSPGSYAWSIDTWYKIKLVVTGIGTASGAITMYVDDVSRASESGIDLSAGYEVTSIRIGQDAPFGAGSRTGALYFDTGWADADGVGGGVANTWKATVTTEPKIVLFDGVRGTNVASVAACDGVREWYWASNTLYTYGTEDPSTTYDSPGVEAGARAYPLYIGEDYITVRDLTLSGSNAMGVRIQSANNVTLDGLTITQAFDQGTDLNVAATYVTMQNMTVTQCGGTGIAAMGDADAIGHITIKDNTVHDCGWNTVNDGYTPFNAGIKVWGGKNYGAAGESDDVLIEGNVVYNQADQFGDLSGTGIWVDQWGTGAIVRYNRVHTNEAMGILVENMDGAQVYYNIVYDNTKAGIQVYRNASSNVVYNNVVTGNGWAGLDCSGNGATEDVMVDNIWRNNISTGNWRELQATFGGDNAGDGSGNIYTHNCLGAEAANFIRWGDGTDVSTYDAWETAYGGSTSSVEADPLLVSAADYHLQAGSPCINAGVDVGLTTDYDGRPVERTPDVGAYERHVGWIDPTVKP